MISSLRSRSRFRFAALLVALIASISSCASTNFTLKPDSLQPGDVVILGRWERHERRNYQAPEKQEWDLSCLGKIEQPGDGRAYLQLGYYPDDLWAVRLPPPVRAPLSIAVECKKIVANTETAYAVPGGRELGLYRNVFEADSIYIMPPLRLHYQSGEIVPEKVEQEDSPAAAKKILTEMLEFWPEFAEREMIVLESSDEEDY